MEKRNLIVFLAIIIIIILVILFWEKFTIKEDKIVGMDYCEAKDDCILAINPYNCCNCPIALNRDVVELDEDYEIYEEGKDYSGYLEEDCSFVLCEACVYHKPEDILCVENKCILIQAT